MPTTSFTPRPRSVIFCEAVAIYGVIVAIILQSKIEHNEPAIIMAKPEAVRNVSMNAGYSMFWAGVCCGIGNLACGCALRVPCPRARSSTRVPPARSSLNPWPGHAQGVRWNLRQRVCSRRCPKRSPLRQDLGHRDLCLGPRHLRHYRGHHYVHHCQL
eukprot:scaffold22249_cov107-Isochrysis_galbana.AAC.1